MSKSIISCIVVLTVIIFTDYSRLALAETPADPGVIADQIIVGIISESDFNNMNLSIDEKVEIFSAITSIRGWSFTKDDLYKVFTVEKGSLPETSFEQEDNKAYLLECSQKVEFYDSGMANIVYPSYYMTASPGECGSDTDDIVIVYNNVYGGNPDYYRWNSNLWWVRTVLTVAYNSGLSANGLCDSVIHVCIGTKGQVLGNDLMYVYLWRY